MKKLILFLLPVLATVAMTSCSNDDELPQVKASIDYAGAVEDDGTFYVKLGDDLSITSITVTPEAGYGKATLGATAYYWNYAYLATTIEEPFGMTLPTSEMPEGDYVLQIRSTVFQENRSVGLAYFSFPVKIVKDYPENPGSGPRVVPSGTVSPDVDMRNNPKPGV